MRQLDQGEFLVVTVMGSRSTSATKSVNRDLETKTRALAGLKGYTTKLTGASAEFVIDAYQQLWRIEKSFRISKHDLQVRPVYHHKRESIEAHLTVVFAALVVSHWIEHQTGWSIKKFVRTARRYAPSPSAPAGKPSPPRTQYPTTSATPSPQLPHRKCALIWRSRVLSAAGRVPLFRWRHREYEQYTEMFAELYDDIAVPKSAGKWIVGLQHGAAQHGVHCALSAVAPQICVTAAHHGLTLLHDDDRFVTAASLATELHERNIRAGPPASS